MESQIFHNSMMDVAFKFFNYVPTSAIIPQQIKPT